MTLDTKKCKKDILYKQPTINLEGQPLNNTPLSNITTCNHVNDLRTVWFEESVITKFEISYAIKYMLSRLLICTHYAP